MLRPRDLAFLQDVARHPVSTVTQRYERLALNPKLGNESKDRLLNAGLVTITTVEYGRSRMKFLELTDLGERLVIDQGVTIAGTGAASAEHEHWRAALKAVCEEHGFTVTREYDLGDGRRVDLRAQRGGTALLFEVETGKSDVTWNVAKCQGHGTLIVFFTSPVVHEAFRPKLPPV